MLNRIFRRFLLCSVLVLALGCLLSGFALTAEAQTQKQLEEVEKSLGETQKELAASKKQRGKSLSEIENIEKQIAERTIRYEQTRVKSDSLDRQADKLEDEINNLEKDFATARKELSRLVESAYLMGRQSGLKLMLSQQGTQHIARLANYARSLSDARQKQLTKMQDMQQQLDSKVSSLNQQRSQLAKLSIALEEDQRYLGQLKTNRLVKVNTLDSVIQDSEQELDLLRTRKAELEKVLAKIKHRQKTRAARKRAQERRLQAIKNTPPKKRVTRTVSRAGDLPLPTQAKIVTHFGDKRKKSGLPWSGILMEGAEGTDIKAISNGEIVFADWLQGYGQLVIIDHGSGIMSLYGHNKRIHRIVGDHVKQSDIIASMGNTAGLKKPALYFEIRQNGVAQNPLSWCRG